MAAVYESAASYHMATALSMSFLVAYMSPNMSDARRSGEAV